MQAPATLPDEAERLAALRALNLLDTPAEERFDRFTRLVKRMFDVPIALVSLVDENRQWFKSRDGLALAEGPRDTSFCGHAICADGILVIPDATLDVRFHDNPLVTGDPHIRFYAGRPLSAPGGHKIGTLCLIDRKPRSLDAEDLLALDDLAHLVERELAVTQLATIDDLTMLSNRRGFAMLATAALDTCRRLARTLTLVYIDMNSFKAINDRFGHAEGDHALAAFAQILKGSLRHSDLVARMGGDEFAVLLTDTDQARATEAVSRFRTHIADWNARRTLPYALDFSAGIVELDAARHHTVHELLADADRAMYAQKMERKRKSAAR